MQTPSFDSPSPLLHDNADLIQKLEQQFGFNQFREGQIDVIKHILSGASSLAIFPTGSGKSLCYQFSALQLANVTAS
ncbi:DEAD/DEAH box helicase [Pseudomonadota bacterium]